MKICSYATYAKNLSRESGVIQINNLVSSVPGKGNRTYLAVALLVLIELGKQFGVVVDQVDPQVVSAVEVIIAGLAGVFLRAGVNKK